MSQISDWVRAYAQQAEADFRAWSLFEKHPHALAAECHKLLFLQMACEKLCKAHVIRAGIHRVADVQNSHKFVAKHLPKILLQEISNFPQRPKNLSWLEKRLHQLAGEIEVLNPAMDRDGRRPDNCEYPWEAGNKVYSPLAFRFIANQLLTEEAGRTFLKVLDLAIARNQGSA